MQHLLLKNKSALYKHLQSFVLFLTGTSSAYVEDFFSASNDLKSYTRPTQESQPNSQFFNHLRRGLRAKTGNFKFFFTPFLKTTYEPCPPTAKPFFRINRASPPNIEGARNPPRRLSGEA